MSAKRWSSAVVPLYNLFSVAAWLRMDPVQAADSVLGRVGHRQAVNLDLKLGRSAADDHQRLSKRPPVMVCASAARQLMMHSGLEGYGGNWKGRAVG